MLAVMTRLLYLYTLDDNDITHHISNSNKKYKVDKHWNSMVISFRSIVSVFLCVTIACICSTICAQAEELVSDIDQKGLRCMWWEMTRRHHDHRMIGAAGSYHSRHGCKPRTEKSLSAFCKMKEKELNRKVYSHEVTQVSISDVFCVIKWICYECVVQCIVFVYCYYIIYI
eukprot:1042225_1